MWTKIYKDTTKQVQLLDKYYTKVKTIIVADYKKDNDYQEKINIEYSSIVFDEPQKVNILVSQFGGKMELSTSDNINYYLKLKTVDANGNDCLCLYLESFNKYNKYFSYSYEGFISLVDFLAMDKKDNKENRIEAIHKATYLFTVGFGFENNNCELVITTNRWKKALLGRMGVFEE